MERKTKNRINGEGSFFFDKSSGRWCGIVTVGFDPSGKQIRKKVSSKSQKIAKQKFDNLRNDIKNSTYVEKDGKTLGGIISYLIEKDKTLNLINDNTYVSKLALLKVINAHKISSINIQFITEMQVLLFLKEQTHYSQSYIKKIYRLIKSAFNYAVQNDIIIKNPMNNIKMPKSNIETKKIEALTIEEEKKFIDALHKDRKSENATLISRNENIIKYNYLLEILVKTGMRVGEILAVDIGDVKLDDGYILIKRTVTRGLDGKPTLGKTTKTLNGVRRVLLTTSVSVLLRNYITNCWKPNRYNLLFYDNSRDKILTSNQVNSYFKRLAERYDILEFVDKYIPLTEKDYVPKYHKSIFYKKIEQDKYETVKRTDFTNWKKEYVKFYYKKREPYKPYNVHMLRHTFATRCIESDVPAKFIQKILGHGDIQTTLNIYCDVFEEHENKSLEQVEKYMNSINIY